jgi:hypothetical protein
METVFRVAEVAVVPLLVALIAGGASVLSVRRLRSENTEQHNHNSDLLHHLSGQVGSIDSKVDRLDSRLDNVQTWQAEHEKVHLIESRDNLT